MIDVITLQSLTLESADKLADLAISKAKDMGLKIHVNIVDTAGDVIVYKRIPGAPLPARLMSEKKAITAANFKAPTDKWTEKVFRKTNLATSLVQHPDITLIGGGVPVKLNDQIVGAIGISGALEEQDVEIANFVISQIS
jgi:glc operon protein GlcG